MPSKQRLHPATLLFDLARHVKRFAVPALLVILGMSGADGPGGRFARVPEGWEVWLLVLFLPATLVSVVRYVTFRLSYAEQELVIRQGLIFRNERHIPFSRIQNVDAVQNAFHRLLGVVDVRLETGGGDEEEARLSVLSLSALDELRARVLRRTEQPAAEQPAQPTLVHLTLKELLLLGFLENKGMVLIGASFGALWETGVFNRLSGQLFGGSNAAARTFFRELFRPFFDGGPLPVRRVAIGAAGLLTFLLLVRIVSMIWAALRLYDFRLTLIGEDLRTEYGLFTRVTATVPLRRVQAITIGAGPLYRLMKRATVRVATAGGAGATNRSAARGREWLAPLIRRDAVPRLLQHVIPGFDLTAVEWQPVHPRAFARAVKPNLILSAGVSAIASLAIGWAALGVAILMLLWSMVATRQQVASLQWADGDDVVMMRSGWIRQQITLARVNKIQAVAVHESPFDRRAAMARVRVDTAGAGGWSHRVDIPYLDRSVARVLADRLSAYAASTAFRW